MSNEATRPAPPNPPTPAVQDEVLEKTPKLLTTFAGKPVTTADDWWSVRRPEVLEFMTREVYGQLPPKPAKLAFKVVEADRNALGGRAIRRQVTLLFEGDEAGPKADLLIYLPNDRPKAPVILALNFWGNHAIHSDPAIKLPSSYVEPTGPGHAYIKTASDRLGHASDATRGSNASMWQLEKLIDRGYGLATIYRGDIDPDLADLSKLPAEFPKPLRLRYPDLQNRPDNLSAMGTWAWCLSRGMDYLETDTDVDAKRVVLFGFSRLGKAALWSAANDRRYAAVISSEAGAGGLKLFHHNVAENIKRLTTNFPHWYCENFRKYVGKEDDLPFDMHFTLGLIAPRPVYVSASEGSAVFDPAGEFLALKAVDPLAKLLGKPTFPARHLPPKDTAVIFAGGGFHYRTGNHDVTAFDWNHYLEFLEMYLK